MIWGLSSAKTFFKKLDQAPEGESKLKTIFTATTEVSSAIITAVSTTIISFLPVFTLQAAEGKLFGPLAYTKTFALVAALIFTLLIMPALAHWVFGKNTLGKRWKLWGNGLLILLGISTWIWVWDWAGGGSLSFWPRQHTLILFPQTTGVKANLDPC